MYSSRILPILLFCLAGLAGAFPQQSAAAGNVKPELNLKALREPLQDLTPDERKTVDEAIGLIERNEHAEALARLNRLTESNGKNSSLRVLRAYVLLELGNAAGALSDAKVAESTGGHAAYKCWFLAQVAYLAGNKPLCHREIKHLSGDPQYRPEVEKLSQMLR